jgi:MFS family permease
MKETEKGSRKNFFCISSFQSMAMFRRGLFYSYLSIYLRHFLGLSVTETTLFATLPMVLNIVFQTFVWGVISDRYQKRRTLIILGELFAAVSTLLVWYIHTAPGSKHFAGYIVIIGMTVVEIFWSASNVGWTAIISDFYREQDRVSVQGKLATIGAVGRFIGVWIGGLAYDGLSRFYEGWGFDRGFLFFVASGVMLLSTVPIFFIPEGGIGKRKGTERESLIKGRLTDLFRISKPFFIFLIAMVFINFGRNSVALIKAQYLTVEKGFDVSSRMLGYIVNMASIATFTMGLVIGRISRRFSDSIILFSGAVIALIHLLGFMLARELGTIFASSFLGGVAEVVIYSASYSYASKLIPPEKRGKQFALFNATFFLSWGLAGTFFAGPVADLLIRIGKPQIFSYQMSFLSAAILVFVGIFILLYAFKLLGQDGREIRSQGKTT